MTNYSRQQGHSSRMLVVAIAIFVTDVALGGSSTERKLQYDVFRQLDTDAQLPNSLRNAAGAPGPDYWQQQADYSINVVLDDVNRSVSASQTVVYTNNSPDTLTYLWFQLDQNRFRNDSTARLSETLSDADMRLTYLDAARELDLGKDKYGIDIVEVKDRKGKRVNFTIVDTLMRVDLGAPLVPRGRIELRIDWGFRLIDESIVRGRSGFEHFPGSDTAIFALAQWYPRVVAYTDYAGWRLQPFLGTGEFTLEFGNYDVAITVPNGHIVAATGELVNASRVLSPEQLDRLSSARNASAPVFIVTPEEALANEKGALEGNKTWRFKAEAVRDFAWASSKKYIWDAMSYHQDSHPDSSVLAMSFYPVEAEPLWSKYSTRAIVHALDVFSRYTFPYPYPTAQSVNTWLVGGMEYPMLSFNGVRPENPTGESNDTIDGAKPNTVYDRDSKYRLISVVIHEVGHNYFPMIVNSDERQWAWMDEGITSFVQYLAELEWELDYHRNRYDAGLLARASEYMSQPEQFPVMTQADAVRNLGSNAYTKPAASLVVLRETVLGRELFDQAFKEYALRWQFKRPTPFDFFRTMEDTSGVDLDWFWRGWYFSTDHVDLAVTSVTEYSISTRNPDVEFELMRKESAKSFPEPLSQRRNREEGKGTRVDLYPELADIYTRKDRFTVTDSDRDEYRDLLGELSERERQILETASSNDVFIHSISIDNLGGLPTPVPLSLTYNSGESEFLLLPAEIWRRNSNSVTKVLVRNSSIASVEIDKQRRTADSEIANNRFPQMIDRSRLSLESVEVEDGSNSRNLMIELASDQEVINDTADGVYEKPLAEEAPE